MAWVYPEEHFDDRDAIDWRDLMVNVNRLATEWNGLWDQDNLPEGIATRGRIEKNAFNECDIVTFNLPQVLAAGQTGGWTTVSDLTTQVTCYDGDIVIDTAIQGDWSPGSSTGEIGSDNWEMRILVDGVAIAETGWQAGARKESALALVGCSPVQAGVATLTVEVRSYRFFQHNALIIENGFWGTTITQRQQTLVESSVDLTLQRGTLVWRHKKR